jgi:hypothetical protein
MSITKYILPLIAAVILFLAILFGFAHPQPPFVALKQSTSQQESLNDYYQQSRVLAANQPDQQVSFLAVGDIMLSRGVAWKSIGGKDPVLPFRQLEALLLSTDFNVGNLESPFSGKDHFTIKGTLIFNAPTSMILGLEAYNFKLLSLANNHAFDQGLHGLRYTQHYLTAHNIKSIGVQTTAADDPPKIPEAWQPSIMEHNGIRIAFIGAAYSSINDGGQVKNDYVARLEDTDQLQAVIAQAKLASDFVVVTMHAGTEYKRNPNQQQITFAHAAIDAGADLVIGHHPHWIQTTEIYQGNHIFYSLGNFIFDQMWSQDTREGLALKINLTKPAVSDLQGSGVTTRLEQIELIPVIIDNYCCPRLADEAEKTEILKKINITETIIRP